MGHPGGSGAVAGLASRRWAAPGHRRGCPGRRSAVCGNPTPAPPLAPVRAGQTVPTGDRMIDGQLAGGVGWVVGLTDALGAPGVGVAIALENVFPPLPSEVFL